MDAILTANGRHTRLFLIIVIVVVVMVIIVIIIIVVGIVVAVAVRIGITACIIVVVADGIIVIVAVAVVIVRVALVALAGAARGCNRSSSSSLCSSGRLIVLAILRCGLVLDLRVGVRGGRGCTVAARLALIAAMVMMIVMVVVVVDVVMAIVVGKWFLFIAISALQTGIADVVAGRIVVIVAIVVVGVVCVVAIIDVDAAAIVGVRHLQAPVAVALLQQSLVQRRLDNGQLVGHVLDWLGLILLIQLLRLVRPIIRLLAATSVVAIEPLLLVAAVLLYGRIAVRCRSLRGGGRGQRCRGCCCL